MNANEPGPSHAPGLPALPDAGWQRVLCIVAHPDDMEYGTSAAVATWTTRGTRVTYALFTSGEAGMAQAPEVVGPLRTREQRDACNTVGVSDLRLLGFPDGMLEANLETRKAVARVVRQVRPQAIVTSNFDFSAYGGLNQADHRAAGMAVVDGARDASNPWVFRELMDDEGLQPWQARALLVTGSPDPTHVRPVNQTAVDKAVASLQCHKAYLQHVTGHPDPAVFIPESLRSGGKLAGKTSAGPKMAGGEPDGREPDEEHTAVEYAVPFHVYDLGGFDADAKEQAQNA